MDQPAVPSATGFLSLLIAVLCVTSARSQTVAWTKTYGGQGKDVAEAIVVTPDGGFIIAGYTHSFKSDSTADRSIYIQGNIVAHYDQPVPANARVLALDVAALPVGVYYAEIEVEGRDMPIQELVRIVR